MKRLLLVLAGWSTLVGGLFLATLSGNVAVQLFSLEKNSKLLIQGLVMSGLVVPIILYWYQRVYRMTGVTPKTPVYSWKRFYHFFTGVLLAIGLASLGFIIAISQGWIVFEKWHTPDQWIIALLINVFIAFLYEALPEELAMRGMVYDVLRNRFVAWQAVLFQTLLFVAAPIAVTQIQVLVGLDPGNAINMPYIILMFCFGICLQSLRLWTGSLWTGIGFHLAYLEITRFVIWPDIYGVPPIITYQGGLGIGGLFISLGMIVIGSIIVSLIILVAKRYMRKSGQFNHIHPKKIVE